jgi:hypothetical protein
LKKYKKENKWKSNNCDEVARMISLFDGHEVDHLDLGSSPVTLVELKSILEYVPNLKILSVSGCREVIKDFELLEFKDCERL